MNRIDKMRNAGIGGNDHHSLFGASQALAWVLEDNVMVPHKAFDPKRIP